jgi:tRNA dimethylallyltransferase
MSETKSPLVVILGPTAVGKTELTIHLAKKLNAEIVSADSMQVYKGMDIGTAKPTLQERQGVEHHLIDVVSCDTPFNVAQYRNLAVNAIDRIIKRGRLPILTGGTGLYIKAVLGEFLFPDQGMDHALRQRLYEKAQSEGRESIYQELLSVDPQTAARLHPNDTRRIVRALEVYHTTGSPLSEHLRKIKDVPPRYNSLLIGLSRPREELYQRIEERVDQQIKDGLIEEVLTLMKQYSITPIALQALGYKEIATYLKGYCSLDEAIETLKKETRRYAKRQYTWFGSMKDIHWYDLSKYSDIEEVIQELTDLISTSFNL